MLLLKAAAAVWRVRRCWWHRVYELGNHDQVTTQNQNGPRIAGRATVVGGAEQRDQVALRKALKAVHHALVRTYNHLQPIGLCIQ